MENLIYYGGEVKALGEGKIAGYLIRFGDPNHPDIEGDFFSKDTDLGVETDNKLPVYYQHGYDSQLKTRKLGKGVVKYDDAGLWLEAQLEMRDEYERMIYQMAEEGKMGLSSGAAGHLVEREMIGKTWHIKSWPIAEASLTPTPAEPRNSAMPVKSLFEHKPEEVEMTDEKKDVKQPDIDLAEIISSASKAAAAEAIKEYKESLPDITADVKVTKDETDKLPPFKKGEFFRAVKNAAMRPHDTDKRLLALNEKSLGLNEAVPSDGGFLVQQDIAGGIYQNIWGVGEVLTRFSPIPVSGNGMRLNAIDETSRADGSRMGGVRAYWLEEGGTKVASRPRFRQINLRLKKVIAACYATDELLEDAPALESWLTNNVPNELRFAVENSFFNGLGVGTPLGMLSSAALIQAVRTNAGEIDSFDITRMWARRYSGANDYVWFINQNTVVQLYNMTLGNYPVYMPPGGVSDRPYGTIFGRPVIETEYNPGLGAVGDILLASPSQYQAITKSGIQAAESMHVQFLTDEMTYRFVYRVDGQPLWEQPVTRFAPSTETVSPFVALAATT